MTLLQLSAGQGPEECCRAVYLAADFFKRECEQRGIKTTILEVCKGKTRETFKSILFHLQGEDAPIFANSHKGAMLWVAESPYRPKHKRKNWFFSAKVYEIKNKQWSNQIVYQACKASGAGGQHVNTTNSAIRAIHVESNISVRVEDERSQHENKRKATLLLYQKLEEQKECLQAQNEKDRWQQHQALERGNPVKVFRGKNFTLS